MLIIFTQLIALKADDHISRRGRQKSKLKKDLFSSAGLTSSGFLSYEDYI